MSKTRLAFLTALLGGAVSIVVLVSAQGAKTPLGRTLEPLFTLLGQGTKTVDRALSRVIPLDDLDEKELGDAFAARMGGTYGTSHEAHPYLNKLVGELSKGSGKPFTYRAFVVEDAPNAFALPGGVVMVTTGLLKIVKSEAELASVVGHEIGHVERGHCFDSARFEMLERKLGGRTLGEIVDVLYGVLTRVTFSKTQESEADEYGYATLLARGYEPEAMSGAFQALAAAVGGGRGNGGPIGDFFASHPSLELRVENYKERAARWHAANADARTYVGVENLKKRTTRGTREFPAEWRP